MFLLWSSAMYGGHKKMNIAYSTRICAWMGLITEWMTGCLLENKYCLSVCMNAADLWLNRCWLLENEYCVSECMNGSDLWLNDWLLENEYRYCLSECMNSADLWMNDWLLAEWILPICMHEWRWSLNEGLAVYCRMNTAYLYAWMVLISEWRTGCLL